VKKWVRAALWVGLVVFYLICRLPPLFGLKWLPGWPTFLSMAPVFIIYPMMFILRPSQKKNAQKWKRPVAIAATLVVAIGVTVALTWASFKMDSKKVIEYLHSPNRKNIAVVFESRSERFGDSKTIYPVRARLLYERKTDNYAHIFNRGLETYAYSWIDENTLEIVTDYGEIGGKDFIMTSYIRW